MQIDLGHMGGHSKRLGGVGRDGEEERRREEEEDKEHKEEEEGVY